MKVKPIAVDIRTDGPSKSGGLQRVVLRGHLRKRGGSTAVDIKTRNDLRSSLFQISSTFITIVLLVYTEHY